MSHKSKAHQQKTAPRPNFPLQVTTGSKPPQKPEIQEDVTKHKTDSHKPRKSGH